MKVSNNNRILNMYRDARREADDLLRRCDKMRKEFHEMDPHIKEMHGDAWNAALVEKYQKTRNMEDRYRMAYNRCLSLLNEIEIAIEGLQDPKARLILRRHFIDGETVEEIARDMHYAAPTIYEIQRKAVRRLSFGNRNIMHKMV